MEAGRHKTQATANRQYTHNQPHALMLSFILREFKDSGIAKWHSGRQWELNSTIRRCSLLHCIIALECDCIMCHIMARMK